MEVILTHEHADFDAISSQVGLARLLPEAVAVVPQHVNTNVADFLTLFGRGLPLVSREDLPRSRIERVWLVDTRQAQPVRGMTPTTPRTVIDHHEDEVAAPDERETLYVEPVGATATLVVERLRQARATVAPLDATLLLLGIHEDTGSLTYSATTPRDLRAAAWLLEHGADNEMIARFLRYPLSEEGRRLLSELQRSAQSHVIEGWTVVVATATAGEYEEELSTPTMKLLDLLEPAALLVLVDVGSHVQLVARSATDAVDVGAIAEQLGGGGHDRAAAAVLHETTVEKARDKVAGLLSSAVRPTARVADIMSRGTISSFQQGQSIGSALELARRHGHEGYPVLDGERLAGVVTRQELDRAERHGLSGEPLERLVGLPPPVVEPTTTLEELQRIMTEFDVGQLPVLESGRMVGIVTRTDILSRWSEAARERSRGNLYVDLEAALGTDDLAAVRLIAEVAEERGEAAYLVGGLPRDILLGRTLGPDIDLVVEGEAEDLAVEVARRHGGRALTHRRFGTAKWIRDSGTIDLVSARSEFYERPSALPDVTRGSLKSDLRRRDFTINALAVAVASDSFGLVIDYFNGLSDLESRRVKVLHSLSFVEDPTRVMRGARLVVRLGFQLGERTEQLIPDAVGLLQRVTGARLLAEVRQVFSEARPTEVLRSFEALGVLEAIQHGLTAGERTEGVLSALPAAVSFWDTIAPPRTGPATSESLAAVAAGTAPYAAGAGLILWLAENDAIGLAAARRLDMPARETRALSELLQLRSDSGVLARPGPPAAELYRALRPSRRELLPLAWLGDPNRVRRANLRRYAWKLSDVKTDIGGDDLARLGVEPGPVYGRILDKVLDAKLAGEVESRDEELELARRLISEEAET